MEYACITPIRGSLVVTDELHNNQALLNNKELYKFIWVLDGTIDLQVDHARLHLEENQVIPFSNIHNVQFTHIAGKYISILFNSNFYCIYKSDSEVSCNGFLFTGYSNLLLMKINAPQLATLERILSDMFLEYESEDSLKEEMLRLHLKRFIITCTRIARVSLAIDPLNESGFYLVRQFFILVDTYFKEKKKVSDYARMLNRSPKTLTNLFALYNLPAPLQVIHERISSEAKRLLLYSNKSATEIAHILGFNDLPSFSRFFKRTSEVSISEFRKEHLLS
ncbi:MAG: helix-turn-helix domain-containing protein [Bacteroidales bacterium]|nr:helix-turn-helix domain-containing protein [Bacteroidales bacterium]